MIADFFKELDGEEVLCFTTFTLDEVVLADLLKKYNVHSGQRIVVFHDIMRHRSPGYLNANYPNSIIYSVILQQKFKNHCPVFHSKIWIRVVKSSRKWVFKKLAITSANLSQYHLAKSESNCTFESFNPIDCKDFELPNDSFVFRKLKASIKDKHLKIKASPETVFIDTRSKLLIQKSNKRVVELINEINEVPILCAAPFINGKAVIKELLYSSSQKEIWAYTDRDKSGNALHAKLFLFNKTAVLGSANLTSQALGIIGSSTINHEVILFKHYNFGEFNGFKRFDRKKLSELFDKKDAEDYDENLPDKLEDWNIQRQQRIKAPDAALLKIVGEKAEIVLTGKFSKTAFVFISNKGDADKSLKIKVFGSVIKPAQKDRIKFAEIISKGNVVVSSISGNEVTWIIELNYGDYWHGLEIQKQQTTISSNSNEKSNIKQNKSLNQIPDYDVREMRRIALHNPKKGEHIAIFLRWLSFEKVSTIHIPEWCQRLAVEISKRNKK